MDIVDPVKKVQSSQGIAHHLRILLCFHQHSQPVFVVNNGQCVIRHNQAVPGTKSFRHPPRKIQALFHQNQRILTDGFGLCQALQHKLGIGIGAFGHFFIKIGQGLGGILFFLPQSLLHLIFAKGMGLRSLPSKLTLHIRQLGTFQGRRRTGQPAVAGRGREHRMVTRHGPSPPVLSGRPHTSPAPYWTACRPHTFGSAHGLLP